MEDQKNIEVPTRMAYDSWSSSYDEMANKTRDLEGGVLRKLLNGFDFKEVLEIGCGTGKNTGWLSEKAERVTAMDFSSRMLKQAVDKEIPARFIEADLCKPWPYQSSAADLVCASLVLEHIHELSFVFSEVQRCLKQGGRFYLSELHPFKQYTGSRARFQGDQGVVTPVAYVHHCSDYLHAGWQHGLKPVILEEHFDGPERKGIPRLLTILFEKA